MHDRSPGSTSSACELAWAGVGNVEARLVRGARRPTATATTRALVLGGVVGYNLPPVRPARPTRPGDAVVFATDGIEADYSGSLAPGLPAQRAGRADPEPPRQRTDDALAAVVRYRAR